MNFEKVKVNAVQYPSKTCKTNLKACVGKLRDGIKTFLLLLIKSNHRLQNSHAIKHTFERRSIESFKDARKITLIYSIYQ